MAALPAHRGAPHLDIGAAVAKPAKRRVECSGRSGTATGRRAPPLTVILRATLAASVAALIAALPAAAVRVDPVAPQADLSPQSAPPPVERIAKPAKAEPSPLLPGAVVLDRALAALDAHLLITGRPIELKDSEVEAEPQPQGPVATPFRYHPATVFEVAMGTVMVLSAVTLVWLPRMRTERRRRNAHRRRSRQNRPHGMAGPADDRERPEKVRKRVRRVRRRRAAAG